MLVYGLTSITVSSQAGETNGVDPETGLRFWRWVGGGVFLELMQRLPDQSRAFSQARGFDAESADIIGLACVFQTIFKNTGATNAGAVEYDLAQWQVIAGTTPGGIKLKEQWDAEWQARGISESSRIAFRWFFYRLGSALNLGITIGA